MEKTPQLRLRLIRNITFALGALLISTASASAENMLKNGGFEENAKHWWGDGLKGGGLDATQPASGRHSLKIVDHFVCQDKVVITGGQHYKLTAKIRVEDTPPDSVYVQMSYRGPGVSSGWRGPVFLNLKSGGERAVFATGGTHDWREFSTVFEAPADALRFLVYLRKIPGSAGTAWFDDLSLTPVAAPQPTASAEPQEPEVPEIEGNLIGNGGFEDGVKNWRGSALAEGGGVADDQPFEGGASLKITKGGIIQDKLPVRAGKTYKVSVRVRTEALPNDSVHAQLAFDGPGMEKTFAGREEQTISGQKQKILFRTGGTRPWEEFSIVVRAPDNAREVALIFRNTSDTGGAVFFDAVSIESTTEPVTTAAESSARAWAAEHLAVPLPAADAAAVLKKITERKSSAGESRIRLAADGQAIGRVHVGSSAAIQVLSAAKDLATFLGDISGADFFPLSHDRHPLDAPLLVIGRESGLTDILCPDIPYEELGEDGFVIRSVGPHIVIAGNTPGGTMYGVNWFLDRVLGVKWLSPDYTHIPSSKVVEVARLDEKQIPRFGFRQILSKEGEERRYVSRNLLNGNSHGFGHKPNPPEINHWNSTWQQIGLTGSFYQLMPPSQWQGNHPHWFSGGQVAMMEPEVRHFMSRAIISRLRPQRNYGNVWFGFMDNDWNWDMDAPSKEFAAKHGGVPSAPRLDMAIDVLKRIREEFPEAKLAINAYHWSFSPPVGMTVPDDILVFPMTIHVDYSTPLNKGRNEKMGQDIAGWNAIAKNILLWDHITNFHGYLQPTPNIYPIGESIQWLATLENIRGYFAEGSWNTAGAEFAPLRVWLMARLLWDPKTDVHAAVAEYCDAYFGPASPAIREYIDLMHAEAERTKAAIWEKTSVESPLLNFEFIRKADALMRRAEAAAAAEPVYLKHVRQVVLNVDYVVLLRRQEFERAAAEKGIAWSADFTARLARFNETVAVEKIRQFRQDGRMDELAAILAIERKNPAPPAMVKNLPASDWREIQDLGINRYYKTTVIVADEKASDGAAARLNGDNEAWVIQVKRHLIPEEGEWEVYAEVRVEAEGAADADTALCVGFAPPMNSFTQVPFGDVKGDGYHVVKVPGGPFRYDGDDGAISYIKGLKSSKIKYIYVDRFFMVRVK